jgi:rRNA maturation protein Nop10
MFEVAPEVHPMRRCVNCDYALEYLSVNRCPECGREFDFTRPETYSPTSIHPTSGTWACLALAVMTWLIAPISALLAGGAGFVVGWISSNLIAFSVLYAYLVDSKVARGKRRSIMRVAIWLAAGYMAAELLALISLMVLDRI